LCQESAAVQKHSSSPSEHAADHVGRMQRPDKDIRRFSWGSDASHDDIMATCAEMAAPSRGSSASTLLQRNLEPPLRDELSAASTSDDASSAIADPLPPPLLRGIRRKTPNRRRPRTSLHPVAILPAADDASPSHPSLRAAGEPSESGSSASTRSSTTTVTISDVVAVVASESSEGVDEAARSMPSQPSPRRDASFQRWQDALRRNREANARARASEWSMRAHELRGMRLQTPPKVVPWHVEDGGASHHNLEQAIEVLSVRASVTEQMAARRMCSPRRIL